MKRSALIVSAAASLFAQQDSPFLGTMTVEGKVLPVRNVCAYEEQSIFDEKVIRIAVIISPVVPSPAAAASNSCEDVRRDLIQQLDASGKPALFLRLTTPDLRWATTSLYQGGKSHSYSLPGNVTRFTAQSGAPPENLAGHFQTQGEAGLGDMPAFQLELKVNVPIEKIVPPGPAITGAAAANHPAAAATKEYLKALSQGNLNRMRDLMTESGRKKFDLEIKGMNLQEMLPMMRQVAASALALPTVTVSMRGEVALVELMSKSANATDKVTFTWQRVGGVWLHPYEQ